MRTALAASCLLTLLAVAYLSASLLILRPPRANYPVWWAVALFVAVQGAVTLGALSRAGASIPSIRAAVAAGGGAMAAVGAWMVGETLSSAHFEGYAVVLGASLAAQGALTLAVFLRRFLKTA